MSIPIASAVIALATLTYTGLGLRSKAGMDQLIRLDGRIDNCEARLLACENDRNILNLKIIKMAELHSKDVSAAVGISLDRLVDAACRAIAEGGSAFPTPTSEPSYADLRRAMLALIEKDKKAET